MSAATQTRIAATGGGSGTRAGRGNAGLRGLIWLTWRQHRWPIVIGAGTTVGLTVWMLITANELSTYAKDCRIHSCAGQTLAKAASYAGYQMNTLIFLPVLLAVFWGVPLLAREYEQRTLPLAWSQDLSPLRWLFGKMAILGVLAGVMGTVMAGTAMHLAHEYQAYTTNSLFEGTAFQAGGWLPLTLGLAWLAVGIAAGAATRRTMSAIAVVGGLWILRMIEPSMPRLRQNFMAPVSGLTPVSQMFHQGGAPGPGHDGAGINDMVISTGRAMDFVTSHGQSVSKNLVMNEWCSDGILNAAARDGKLTRGGDPMLQCLQQHDIVGSVLKYQPGSRMGTFHMYENAMNLGLLVLSVLVAWFCVRRTRTTV